MKNRIKTLLDAKEKQFLVLNEKTMKIRELEQQQIECINDEIKVLAKYTKLQKTLFGQSIKVKYF